jgi:glutathione S-transferase
MLTAAQVSGLGPSQGQAVWFLRNGVKDLHPSVVERYQNETYRIFSVLEKRLEDAGEWIALKRFTVVGEHRIPLLPELLLILIPCEW